jgi:hypothetical protein
MGGGPDQCKNADPVRCRRCPTFPEFLAVEEKSIVKFRSLTIGIFCNTHTINQCNRELPGESRQPADGKREANPAIKLKFIGSLPQISTF